MQTINPTTGEPITPRVVIRPGGIPALPSEGQYVVFDSNHRVVASDDDISIAYNRAVDTGIPANELTVSFNNKTQAVCLW